MRRCIAVYLQPSLRIVPCYCGHVWWADRRFRCLQSAIENYFFGFYSPDLEGFTGISHSIENCVYKALSGMADHVEVIRQQGLPVPPSNPDPTIVIQNERKLQPA